jgi:serine-type D-Ala-D-Ala carboxypeptidase/endopeptidase (penicillin-binding protein 4)
MPRRVFFALLLSLLLTLGLPPLAPPAAAESLPAPILNALRNHQLDGKGLSIFVQAVDAQEPLLAFNEHVLRNPASVAKVLTSYAALDLLGPAYRWHTEVWVTGPVRDGRLEGDLVIRGGGDPSLTTERLWTMLREIRARGIVEIAGDLVIDDTLFAPNHARPGDFDSQPYRAYNVLPSALLVNYNVVTFHIRNEGRNAVVQVDPPMHGFRVENRIESPQGACSGAQNRVAFDLPGGFTGRRAVLSGQFASSCRELTLWRSVLGAPQFADAVIRYLWIQMGGSIAGELRVAPVPEGARRIVSFPSRPLAEQLRDINKWSNNVMTRHLFLTIGLERHGPPATVEKGREAVEEWLEQRGLYVPGMFIDNGSGLSRRTRVTADMFGRLLIDAWHHPLMPDLVASMPISAVDGTLRNRLRGDTKGRMHLKTGRLNNVSTIAGIVTSKSGQRYAVVVFKNQQDAPGGAGEAIQDAVLRWVHNQ